MINKIRKEIIEKIESINSLDSEIKIRGIKLMLNNKNELVGIVWEIKCSDCTALNWIVQGHYPAGDFTRVVRLEPFKQVITISNESDELVNFMNKNKEIKLL